MRNVDKFLFIFVEKFRKVLFSQWYSEVCSLDKLSLYREYKFSLEPERYLRSINISSHRQMLARFRCSSHFLRIETDRKHGIERNQRICLLCDSNEVEDEYHFLLVCSFFNHYREKYISRFYFDPPSVQNFVDLLSSNNVDTLQRLAVFLFHAMKL